MNVGVKSVTFSLAFALAASGTFCAYADGTPLRSTEETAVTKEENAARTAQLRDNKLEYEELPELIDQYNPSLLATGSAVFYDSKKNYQSMEKAFRKNASELKSWQEDLEKENGFTKEQARDVERLSSAMASNDMEAVAKLNEKYGGNLGEVAGKIPESYYVYAGNATGFTAMADAYGDILENLDKPSGTASITMLRNTMTKAAQSLMNQYNQLSPQRELLEKNKELMSVIYDQTVVKMQNGLATPVEVYSAQKNQLVAESAYMQVDSALTQIKQNLLAMTGWPIDADIQIQSVPQPDMGRIDTMNPEVDANKAAGNISSVTSARHSIGSAKSNGQKHSSQRTANEMEQKAAITVSDLYQAVLEKKLQCESARTAYESAVLNKQAADRKNGLGMLSRTQYLQQEAAFLQSKAAKESAELALTQAIEDYNWGLEGIASIE